MRSMIRITWRPWLYLSSGALMDAYILSIRDQFRTVLDGDALHTNWLVSDIARWQGLGSYVTGYCFVVYHRNGGVNTGPAWLFVLPGSNQSNASAGEFHEVFGLATDGNITPYFINITGVGNLGANDGDFGFHYCATGGTTTPYNGGWDANGELSGGDFTVPTFNPYTNIADFMPAPDLRGVTFQTPGVSYAQHAVVIFDADFPFCAVYSQYGNTHHLGQVGIFGKIIVPYLDTDPYTDACFIVNLTQNTTTALPTFNHQFIHTKNPQGVLMAYTMESHNRYNNSNTPLPNGEYAWEPVWVINNDNVKGFLHTELFRVIGRNEGEYRVLFHGGKLLKCTPQVAFPYVEGEPVFPGGF